VRQPARRLLVLLLGAAITMALAATSAAQPAPGSRPDWRGNGVVVALLRPPSELHATRPVIVLKHDPIPGLMDQSMYMPFIVASPSLFEGLSLGERVTFGLKETPDALLVISIERLPP
jgi:Copper binding periplasmic protein CusF